MPKSDTWPGGVGLEASGMESAGSCDSVVSANSGFSDDSLKHLSAEEKACLMFLEETIESLDTEEDSGLSNDEFDQMPKPGDLVTDVADLSASVSKSKLSDLQNHASKEPMKENDDTEFLQNYHVPKSVVEARSTDCSVPSTNISSKPQLTPSNKSNHKPPNVHFEVNVVKPPPTKPKDYPVRTAEGPIARGPLSYEALVYLQRSASTKKTPLCPTVDHTIELDKNLPGIMEGSSDRSHSKSKRSPPSVAPKPKVIPANISMKTQKETLATSDSAYNIKHAKDPHAVRQEALQKLGLLKDQQPENGEEAPGSHPKSSSSLDPIFERSTKGPGPSRSPSFCYSQVPTKQSASTPHAPLSGGSRTAALEHSVPINSPRGAGKVGDSTGSEHAPTKPSNSVEYTVMVVPGMGADRREALRKLGLLKQ